MLFPRSASVHGPRQRAPHRDRQVRLPHHRREGLPRHRDRRLHLGQGGRHRHPQPGQGGAGDADPGGRRHHHLQGRRPRGRRRLCPRSQERGRDEQPRHQGVHPLSAKVSFLMIGVATCKVFFSRGGEAQYVPL